MTKKQTAKQRKALTIEQRVKALEVWVASLDRDLEALEHLRVREALEQQQKGTA